jgi:ATP-dependent helicase HrpB
VSRTHREEVGRTGFGRRVIRWPAVTLPGVSTLQLPALPIVDVLPELRTALAAHAAAVLEAPPGAGKSTVVPLALLDAGWLGAQRIVMLEPRRVAARAVAERMATTLGEAAGATVGYRTRTDTRVGARTRIEVVTEGILTRRLQRDPTLEGVGCVIFDEFHERSLHADLGLALTLDVQAQLRETLRILVMSATLDGAAVARLLGGAPLIRSQARMFPVETSYAGPAASRPEDRLERRMATAITRALTAHEGDLLAFLPGAGEIRRTAELLDATTGDDAVRIRPLYGELAVAAQDAALRPEPDGRRKVVLATNLAETSLTIEGVRIVIDGGYERRPRFDPASGMSGLELRRISQASTEQRRGRAGRTAPGVCYRLWSESTQASLAVQTPPEVVEADLASLALELACWGTVDATTLRWLDPPPEATLAQARELLHGLEAIDSAGRATPLGRRMAALGLHPRLAHMVVRSEPLQQTRLAMELAALLSERDPLRAAPGARDPDVRLRIDVLHGAPPPAGMEVDRGALQRIRQSIERLERELTRAVDASGETRGSALAQSPDAQDAVALLLAFAYPDRIGRAREGGGGRYLLSGGRGAAFAGPTALARSEYIVVAALDLGQREARIELAAPLELPLLEKHFAAAIEERDTVGWDARIEALLARRQARLGALLLRDEPLPSPDAAAVSVAVLDGIRTLGLAALPWRPELTQWRARVAFARAQEPDGAWPDVSDGALLASLETWLAPWLGGVTRREQFARIDLRGALHGLLDRRAQRRLDEFAPTHLVVPSGSRVAIDYGGATPTLAVRLQEVFGLNESPTIAGGRVPVTMELLSPARRPVQVTRDLASFWARGYAEVRRELKGRYPKHYWPEDPHQAEATRRIRPR